MSRAEEKLEELEKLMKELKGFFPTSKEGYTDIIKAATERYVEKIVECIIKISSNVAKEKGFPSGQGGLEVLRSHNIIKEELFRNLIKAKGMRNNIIHNYDIVNDNIVFKAVRDNLFNDATQFAKEVRKCLS